MLSWLASKLCLFRRMKYLTMKLLLKRKSLKLKWSHFNFFFLNIIENFFVIATEFGGGK